MNVLAQEPLLPDVPSPRCLHSVESKAAANPSSKSVQTSAHPKALFSSNLPLTFLGIKTPLSTACVCRADGRACARAAAQPDTRTGVWTEAGTRGRAGSQDRLCPGGNTLGWPATSAPGQLNLRQRPAWFQRTKLGVWWNEAGKEESPHRGTFSSCSSLWATGASFLGPSEEPCRIGLSNRTWCTENVHYCFHQPHGTGGRWTCGS